MKRILSLLFACTLIAGTVTAQTVEKSEKTHQQVVVDSILKVVESIKTLQEESKADRDRVWKEKKKHRAKSEGENSENVPTQYGAMLQIEKNTHQNWCSDGWNFFGIATILVAIISAIYTIVTYRAQHKTEKHTTNAPIDVQLWKLKDLPRHFYRNLVCTGAIIYRNKYDNGKDKRENYPSESNLLKLETLPDDIVLPIDIDKTKNPEENYYTYMHELRLLLRNYNVEVEVAAEHLSRPHISEEALKQDYDNLLFKPLHLTVKTFNYEKALSKDSNECLMTRSLATCLSEHFEKLRTVGNFKLLLDDKAIACIDRIQKQGYKDCIDFKEGIDRSISNLPKYKKEEDEKTYGKNYTKDKDYNSVASVTLKNMIKAEAKAFMEKLLAVTDASTLIAFYSELTEKETTDSEVLQLTKLYELLKPYIDYLRQEQWDVHTFLKHILTIDIAIEIDRIGMVNFD